MLNLVSKRDPWYSTIAYIFVEENVCYSQRKLVMCFYNDVPCYAEIWPSCFSHHQNIALWPRYVGYSLYYNHTYKRVISVAFNCISNFVVLHMHDRTNHSFIPLPRQGYVFPIETGSNMLLYMVALLQKKRHRWVTVILKWSRAAGQTNYFDWAYMLMKYRA